MTSASDTGGTSALVTCVARSAAVSETEQFLPSACGGWFLASRPTHHFAASLTRPVCADVRRVNSIAPTFASGPSQVSSALPTTDVPPRKLSPVHPLASGAFFSERLLKERCRAPSVTSRPLVAASEMALATILPTNAPIASISEPVLSPETNLGECGWALEASGLPMDGGNA